MFASFSLFSDEAYPQAGFVLQDAASEPPSTDAVNEEEPPRQYSRRELCSTVAMVAQANNLPAPFFANLIQQESGFRPDAVSPAGAQGIAQFMPRVAAAYDLPDPFDPIRALHASGKFLSELHAKFGNLGLAAAAYNAGPKRVQDWMARRGKLPSETRKYVRNVTGRPAEQWVRKHKVASLQRMPLFARCAEIRAAMAQAVEAKSTAKPAHSMRKRLAGKARAVLKRAAASAKRTRLASR